MTVKISDLGSTQVVGWDSGAAGAGSKDTGISRTGAAAIAFGNGTQGDTSASITAGGGLFTIGTGAITSCITGDNTNIFLSDSSHTATGQFKISATGLSQRVDGQYGFTSGNPSNTNDTILTRGAAATWQLGAADAAAPVAQALQVQSVVAGTTDTAGANFTLTLSKSTGLGVGGQLLIQATQPAGGTGSTQNAPANVFTMGYGAYNQANIGGGLLPVIYCNSGASCMGIGRGTNTVLFGASNAGTSDGYIGGGEFVVRSGFVIGWTSSNSDPYNTGSKGLTDTFLTRKGAANMQIGNADAASPVAQTTSVQSVVAGTSNTAGVNWTRQGSISTGTGAAGTMLNQTGFAGVIQTTQSVTCTSASPCVVTLNNHGFVSGQPFQFGGSAAPGGSALTTTYYVLTVLTANTFTLALTLANWQAGTVFNSSSTGTAVTLSTIVTAQNPASTVATWGPSGLTGSQTTSILNLAQSWNTSGNTTALLLNVTNTASGATSKLMDLQVGGSTQFNISKAGTATFIGQANLAAGTTAIAPLQYTSGTNLTSAVAGAREFDGVQHYATIDTTSGRAAIASEQYFHLTGNGGTISSIGNFFGTTSNISLVANAHYIIEAVMWYSVQTGGQTVTWTLTNTAAPTNQNIYFEMSPVTGIVAPPGTATMLIGQIQGDTTATKALTATGTLTNAVTIYTRIKIWLQNGTGTSLKIQATSSANTITPLNGSWWTCRRMSPNNIGTFAA